MFQLSAQRVRKRLIGRVGMVALVATASFGAVGLSTTGAAAAPGEATGAVWVTGKGKVDGLAPIAGRALSELYTYTESGAETDLAAYRATRDAIADEVAHRLEIEPIRMERAWEQADLQHQTALLAALTQLGTPYRRNTSKPGVGFDCSGLTTFAWSVAGVTLTRQSGSQIRAASPRTPDTAQAGDLMYYPGHAMLYLGVDRAILHAPQTGRTVEVDNLSSRRSVKLGDPTG